MLFYMETYPSPLPSLQHVWPSSHTYCLLGQTTVPKLLVVVVVVRAVAAVAVSNSNNVRKAAAESENVT